MAGKKETPLKKRIKQGAAGTTSGGYAKRRGATKPDRSGVGHNGRYITRQRRYRDLRAAFGLSTG